MLSITDADNPCRETKDEHKRYQCEQEKTAERQDGCWQFGYHRQGIGEWNQKPSEPLRGQLGEGQE